jgi:hypothetical protein
VAPSTDDSPDAPATSTPMATTLASPNATAEPSLPLSSEPPFVPSPLPDRSLSLAAISAFPPDLVAELAAFYSKKLGIDVEILTPSPLDQTALDQARNQLVAEDLIAALTRSYPKPPSEQGKVIIGLLTDDLYIRDRPDWDWAFGLRGDRRYAVVSTARMGGLAEPIAPIVKSRLRKMVMRDIGVLYYGLPLNHDPFSVLYVDLLGLDDLDRMGEDLCGSDCPGIAMRH